MPTPGGPYSGIWKIKDISKYIQDDAWPEAPPFPNARGVFGGGYTFPLATNTIDYVTIQTTGNASDFGDLTQARPPSVAMSSGTRAIFSSADTGGPAFTQTNILDYVTIASAGNATDFGDDFSVSAGTSGAASNSTRGILAGGYAPSRSTNTIRYITMASTGNTTDFGDLTVGRYQITTTINSPTRGVWAGGNT